MVHAVGTGRAQGTAYREPVSTRRGGCAVIEDMPGWLRIASVIGAVLLIPAINISDRIYTRIKNRGVIGCGSGER